MKINALIKKINRELPEAKAVSTKEWDGSDDGIWFRGSEDYVEADQRLIFGGGWDVHPKLEKILHDAGWFAEPYDSGTLMAYN
tara:strand:- start:2559 stop:2807 length:249 start_codon:yes stop_codon:yes gene_type:complete